jgi:hypothetical protein
LANLNIEKLSKQARVMLLGIALSALGNGLVLPYTLFGSYIDDLSASEVR